jgi:hypothetical protein
MSNVLLPVLAGDPAQALDVHCLISCSIPLRSLHVTVMPVSAIAVSGLKQNDVPPPLHGPEVIVIPVVAEPRAGRRMTNTVARNTAASNPRKLRA